MRARRQAKPLNVAAVTALEHAAVHSLACSDRVMAGFFTIMTPARARHDNVTMCLKTELDMVFTGKSGYVEVTVTNHISLQICETG
eukprot:3443580-Amphidinium_carterae.1